MYGKIHQELLIFFPLLIKSGSADNHSIFNLLLGGVETSGPFSPVLEWQAQQTL